MTDRTHLNALELGLSNERMRLAEAKTDAERELRAVWIEQREQEIAGEYAFFGLEQPIDEPMTMDEILAELGL